MEILLHIITFLSLTAAVLVLAKKAVKKFDKLSAQLEKIQVHDSRPDLD